MMASHIRHGMEINFQSAQRMKNVSVLQFAGKEGEIMYTQKKSPNRKFAILRKKNVATKELKITIHLFVLIY